LENIENDNDEVEFDEFDTIMRDPKLWRRIIPTAIDIIRTIANGKK